MGGEQYLIPANSKKSMLILGFFNPTDLIIFGTGLAITFILLFTVQSCKFENQYETYEEGIYISLNEELLDYMEKVKKIAKYLTNILAIVSALVAGINAVEGITIPYAIQIVQIIAVVQGVIGTYLLGQKAISKEEK